MICLQETKIAAWTDSLILEAVGADLAQDCVFLPTVGTSGGVLIAASQRFFRLQHVLTTENTVFANLVMLAENISWSISGVYAPQTDAEKNAFIQEITNLKQHMIPAWLMSGDFNLIYRAQDKNNNRINLSLLNTFRSTIDNLQMAAIDLVGKNIPGATTSKFRQ